MAFDRAKFIEKFRGETRERIQRVNQGLIQLEKNPVDEQLLQDLMREAHSIKGTATMMGFNRIADIAHRLESGLERARKKELQLRKVHYDIIFKCLDTIEVLLEDKVVWYNRGIDTEYLEKFNQEIADVFAGKIKETVIAPPTSRQPEPEKEHDPEQVRPAVPYAETTIRVDIDKLNRLMNLSGEMIVSKIRLQELVRSLVEKSGARRDLEEAYTGLINELSIVGKNIDFSAGNIQDRVIEMRMVPVASLFNLFPRAMRDLAQKVNKDIDLVIKGEDTQLDKLIVDEMKDPFMHLLRNAVDHGVEGAAERRERNKPPNGTITLKAYHKGSQVVLEVADDGGGIDLNKIKQRAVERGLVSPENVAGMIPEQIYKFMFMPGFSTREEAGAVSGRGVGLDVVRDRIAKLKGIVDVYSEQGKGSRFVMKFPLTLAVTESLLVSSGTDTFAVPLDMITETIRIDPREIKTVETKETVTVRGYIMPLVRFSDIFGLPKKGIFEKRYFPVVIAQFVAKRIALLVDQVFGCQEIVSKSLGDPLRKIRHIAGGTILGSGDVVLILDIPSIIDSAEGGVVRRAVAGPAVVPRKMKRRKTILLAEDAVTTATLEKNILESVGYSVVTARDGAEALKIAAQEKFDLVITDILMPRMNGFELTEKLKQDRVYKNVPVIIVTTRESDADKRRGLEAGADAYILKSEFTSEGLLETIGRLIG